MNFLSLLLALALSNPLWANFRAGSGKASGGRTSNASAAASQGGLKASPTTAPLSIPTLASPLGGTAAPRVLAPEGALALPVSAVGSEAQGPGASQAKAPAKGPYFLEALKKLGAGEELVGRLYDYQTKRHPGEQNKIYHGLTHSQDVPSLMSAVFDRLPMALVSRNRRALLLVAAALHDIDPARVPGTPARVAATLEYLSQDPESRALLAEFGEVFAFTPGQVQALIKATDFHMDPAVLAKIQEDFQAMARAEFPEEADRGWAVEWGRRLAFVDKAVSYVGTVETAAAQVRNLAGEIRAGIAAATGKTAEHPTADEMSAGTPAFLKTLRESPEFSYLPPEFQSRFESVQAYFLAQRGPPGVPKASAPGGDSPAKAAPQTAEPIAFVLGSVPRNAEDFSHHALKLALSIRDRAKDAKAELPASEIGRRQQIYKTALLAKAREAAAKAGLKENEVVSHGAQLRKFWGMILKGRLEASNPYPGFKGESYEVWGVRGIEGAASYGAVRGVQNNLPGVVVLMHNRAKPLQVIGGETLDREPTVEEDFLAAVVTDGTRTVVIEKKDLQALGRLALEWRRQAVRSAQGGSMTEVERFQRLLDFYAPDR